MYFTVESDIGLKRTVNEDRAAFIERPDHFKLAVLADGMGGHNAGDVASEMTIQEMKKLFLQVETEILEDVELRKKWLQNAVSHINEQIYRYSLSHEGCEGMGTTVIAAVLDEKRCSICHVGDSRVYQFTESSYQLITRDHSFVNALLEKGAISEEEAINHPKKNLILKAVGTEASIESDLFDVSLTDESYLLICSDGLSNKLTPEEMAALLTLPLSLKEKGKKLVQLANDSGGEDNISLILISMHKEEVR